MSFKFKTILLFLLVSLVPYTVTMLIFGASLREEQSQSITNELHTQLELSMERIDQNLQNLQKDLAFMARSEVMNDLYSNDLDHRISRMLLSKKEDLGLIGDFFLTTPDGRIIASSNFAAIGTAMKQAPLFEKSVISSFENRPVGTLCVVFRLENLQRFFTNSSHRHYYLITGAGEKRFRPQEFSESVQVEAPVTAMPGVRVVLEEDKAFAYRLAEKFESWFLLTLGIGGVVIIIIALLFAVALIRPLLRLSHTARTITQTRDYTTQVPIDRKDEIGQLASAFNQMIRGMETALREITTLNREIEATQREVVFTMGAIGESRSKETGNHVKRVAEYSRLLALHYGLSNEEAEMLKQASPMHDIGKVAIPDAILNKPGRFDEAEFELMKKHAELGYEMLKASNRPLLEAAAVVAYEHHEKYDGSGYPRGLSGDGIHIFGRITALADVFDALGSARVYKETWDDERIFKLFKEERGKHFDPRLVDIFFEHLEEFLAIRARFKDL